MCVCVFTSSGRRGGGCFMLAVIFIAFIFVFVFLQAHSPHKHTFSGVFVKGATTGREDDKPKVKLHI